MPDSSDSKREASRPVPWFKRWWFRGSVLLAVVVLAGLGYWLWGDELSLDRLAHREQQLRSIRQEYPVASAGAAFLFYLVATALSIPWATMLTLLYGWLFPWWVAVLITSFASTGGATLAMLLSRYLFRDVIQRWYGERLEAFNRELEREGAYYLFTARLIPLFPFVAVNLLAGLSPMRAWTFWWVSQVGMLPGTLVYVTAGHSVPSLQEIRDEGAASLVSAPLLISLAILGLFPLVVRISYRFMSRDEGKSGE